MVTGDKQGAGTTARVFLEVYGEEGASGEHRLMYKDEQRPIFQVRGTV